MTKAYRHYNKFLAILIGCAVVILIATSLLLEPLSGDLTRLGGYSENEYGWKQPQERFSKPLYDRDSYDHYYDIVVFGDSFTYKNPGEQTDPGSYWQNYLVNDTGLSLVIFDLNRTDINQVISSPVYQNTPPAVVIYEAIERDLIWLDRYTETGSTRENCRPYETINNNYLKQSPLQLSPLPFQRSSVLYLMEKDFPLLNISYAADYLKKAFTRNILNRKNTPVINFKLSRNDLFSNATSDQLLIYKQEMDKSLWNTEQISHVKCNLIALQNLIQKSGKTYFLLMIPPDKSTAYRSYIDSSSFNFPEVIDLLSTNGLNLVRVDKKIGAAIDSGIKDIYLPNDTHWGSAGHKIASRAIIKYMRESSIVKTND